MDFIVRPFCFKRGVKKRNGLFRPEEKLMKFLKKCLGVTVLFAAMILAATFVSCGDDNGGSEPDNTNEKVKEGIAILPEETVNLSETQSIELRHYSYEVACIVPDKNGKSWTASLTFDQEDRLNEDGLTLGEFAYIYPESGKGKGAITLCVFDAQDLGRSGNAV